METSDTEKQTLSLANENFQEDPPRAELGTRDEADMLLLKIDGYEGPIEVLLELARSQKVDLRHISILQLVRQYLDFVERAKELRLSLAAEYLVMAAWLTYLKSRLLLPNEEVSGDEPTGEEMAEALQFQLHRLGAMQKAGDELLKGNILGQAVFARGMSEKLQVNANVQFNVSLYDILNVYGKIQRRKEYSEYTPIPFELMSMDEASERLTKMLGNLPRSGSSSAQSVWATLESFLPEKIKNPLYGRSTIAATLTAGLEMVKQGHADVRQDGLFRPIYMRATTRKPIKDEVVEGVR